MLNKRSKIRILIFIILGYLILAGLYFGYNIAKAPIGKLEYLNAIPSDYLAFFKDSVSQKIQKKSALKSAKKNPIVIVDFINTEILIYKIDGFSTNESLKNIIYRDDVNSSKSNGPVYYGENATKFSIYCLYSKLNNSNKIFLSVTSKQLHLTNVSDSLLSYFGVIKNFSIRYSKDGTIDFGGAKIKTFAPFVPVNLAFIKRSNEIYFLVAYSIRQKEAISKSFLSELLKV